MTKLLLQVCREGGDPPTCLLPQQRHVVLPPPSEWMFERVVKRQILLHLYSSRFVTWMSPIPFRGCSPSSNIRLRFSLAVSSRYSRFPRGILISSAKADAYNIRNTVEPWYRSAGRRRRRTCAARRVDQGHEQLGRCRYIAILSNYQTIIFVERLVPQHCGGREPPQFGDCADALILRQRPRQCLVRLQGRIHVLGGRIVAFEPTQCHLVVDVDDGQLSR